MLSKPNVAGSDPTNDPSRLQHPVSLEEHPQFPELLTVGLEAQMFYTYYVIVNLTYIYIVICTSIIRYLYAI